MSEALDKLDALGIPTVPLKECVHDIGILHSGLIGEKCPRCGGTDFWKRGSVNYKGQKLPRRVCKDCGYALSVHGDPTKPFTRVRAARYFNLDKKKVDNLIYDTRAFGLIKETNPGTYGSTDLGAQLRAGKITLGELYNNIPIYRHLVENLGFELKRRKFEDALTTFPEGDVSGISKVKRDVLWRRYQEIAIEIFVCEKTCAFSRTCKKDHRERKECSTVKKALKPKRVWKVDIVI